MCGGRSGVFAFVYGASVRACICVCARACWCVCLRLHTCVRARMRVCLCVRARARQTKRKCVYVYIDTTAINAQDAARLRNYLFCLCRFVVIAVCGCWLPVQFCSATDEIRKREFRG